MKKVFKGFEGFEVIGKILNEEEVLGLKGLKHNTNKDFVVSDYVRGQVVKFNNTIRWSEYRKQGSQDLMFNLEIDLEERKVLECIYRRQKGEEFSTARFRIDGVLTKPSFEQAVEIFTTKCKELKLI